jgi:hypothetical protein
MQDERIREDAKQLLRVAYEREVAGGDVGLGVDLPAAAEERGVGHDSRYLAALVDFMEVAGWIEPDPGADPIGRGEVGMPVRRITGRGAEVLREAREALETSEISVPADTPPDAPGDAHEATESPEAGESDEAAEPRSWWRRIFRN